MNHEAKAVQFDEFATNLNAMFDEVEAQDEGITVERKGKLYRVTRLRRAIGRAARRSRQGLTPDDPMWDIVGIGASHGPADRPTDVSSNTDTYLADAYADLHESNEA